MGVKIDSINFVGVQEKLRKLTDEKTMKQIHNSFATFLDPYVPKDTGMLAHDVTVTSEYIQYDAPRNKNRSYAHYMYTGIVYGPNIPIIENGVIVGYFSPRDKPKHPTGAQINYNREMHPQATHHWDKRAMEEKGDEFIKDVEKILKDRLKEG